MASAHAHACVSMRACLRVRARTSNRSREQPHQPLFGQPRFLATFRMDRKLPGGTEISQDTRGLYLRDLYAFHGEAVPGRDVFEQLELLQSIKAVDGCVEPQRYRSRTGRVRSVEKWQRCEKGSCRRTPCRLLQSYDVQIRPERHLQVISFRGRAALGRIAQRILCAAAKQAGTSFCGLRRETAGRYYAGFLRRLVCV